MTEPSGNICIIGAGASGLYFTAMLAKKMRVWLLLRDANKQVLENRDIELSGTTSQKTENHCFSIITKKDLAELPKNITYLLCVKAYDLDQSIQDLLPHLSIRTPLVLTQNGLGIFMQASEQVGRKAPMLRLLSQLGVNKIDDTIVEVNGQPKFSLACLEQDLSIANDFEKVLKTLDAKVDRPKNIVLAEWQKCMVNLVVNPICSILNKENGIVLKSEPVKNLSELLLKEIRAVAKAEGFDLSTPSDQEIFQAISNSANNINSNLADLRTGKQTEMPYLLGRFVKLAEAYGISVPVGRLLYKLHGYVEERRIWKSCDNYQRSA